MMIPITFNLCNNIMTRASLDIRMHTTEKYKKRRKKKQRPHQINQRLAAAIGPPVVMTPRLQKKISKMAHPRR
jgi:hypothetical protein